jgi:hypothetical protein
MNYQKMPFGKYKGELLNNLPSNYIIYAIDEFDLPDELHENLKSIIYSRLFSKKDNALPIKSIYRQMAKKYHPDAGGSHECMAAITDFYNLISERL